MRNKLSKFALAAGFVLALAFTLSCSSDSNNDRESYRYCVFFSTEKCLDGPFTTCSQGGTLSNNCPFQQISSSSTISSSSPKQETYYMEMGTVSETAYDYVKDLDISAKDAVSYCHRYPYPTSMDKYVDAESGISRAKLEEELESLPSGRKAVWLRSLDKDGAVFGLLTDVDGTIVFLYIEKEK